MNYNSIEIPTLSIFDRLQQTTVFQGVSDELLWFIAKKSEVLKYLANSYVEDIDDAIYIILSGEIEKMEGKQTLLRYKSSDVLGLEESLLDQKAFAFRYKISSREAELIRVKRRIFLSVIEEEKDATLNIAKYLAKTLNDLQLQLVHEKKRASDIDSILDRFNTFSRSFLIKSGQEIFEEKYLLDKSFKIKDLREENLHYERIKIEEAYFSPDLNNYLKIKKYETDRGVKYFYTEKQNEERLISQKEYEVKSLNIKGKMIVKTRYKIKNMRMAEVIIDAYEGHLYPLMLAEASFVSYADKVDYEFPKMIKKCIVKEVSEDKNFNDKILAFS